MFELVQEKSGVKVKGIEVRSLAEGTDKTRGSLGCSLQVNNTSDRQIH